MFTIYGGYFYVGEVGFCLVVSNDLISRGFGDADDIAGAFCFVVDNPEILVYQSGEGVSLVVRKFGEALDEW